MKRIFTFLLKLSLGFLVSCAVVPTASEKNPTLLVGEIAFVGNNHPNRNGISFNGTTTAGIEIVLRNTATNELLHITSGKSGLFYTNLKEGEYFIDELYIIKKKKKNSSRSFEDDDLWASSKVPWASLGINPAQKVLEIERGKVNNVGSILWSIDSEHDVIQTDNPSSVKSDFAKQFPKSNWNEKEWKYNQLSLNTKKFSDEKITYFLKSNDGQDSTLLIIPKDTPDEIRRQIETVAIKRINDMRAQGDTTYYVKSENGLDSISLRIPKGMPDEEKRRVEKDAKNKMYEDRLQGGKVNIERRIIYK